MLTRSFTRGCTTVLGRAWHVMLLVLLLYALLLLALLLAGCHEELLVQLSKDSSTLQHALLHLL